MHLNFYAATCKKIYVPVIFFLLLKISTGTIGFVSAANQVTVVKFFKGIIRSVACAFGINNHIKVVVQYTLHVFITFRRLLSSLRSTSTLPKTVKSIKYGNTVRRFFFTMVLLAR